MKFNVKLGVVIPCYKVEKHILNVISRIPSFVEKIYIVDDCCPNNSGKVVESKATDNRIEIIYHSVNKGVGGAVISGYRQALKDEIDIVIKIDGDGQMPPEEIHRLVSPIIRNEADYCKGNRFYDLTYINRMPITRIFGNAGLSFITKLSSGYWNVFDPTNGYTAIDTKILRHINLNKLSCRYFFESDILFHLNIVRAKVLDIPMDAIYDQEESNLSIRKTIPEFLIKNTKNTFKRIFYNYYLRDFSLASIELIVGITMILFGSSYGMSAWYKSLETNTLATPGTVMLSALPIILGVQLFLGFISYDIANTPKESISKNIGN